ncbi:glycosyl hydrolase [Ktedonosporobacter rubrisoli]|uniref:Glycosyl hydrolase n=1 Tax=Ktedonosporobacter rubrisoli TaxID=2509675 RepID=A0A4P6JKJ1_KTERU|nr:family 10 glycosylhydrolase [Ktedonosporobacter rubrisoli]QBD75679.1 glycosyl hydrolase [Ktedonosporobacter rubrisoli]
MSGEMLSSPRQFRAAWVATVTNIDWPSQPGLPVDTQKQQFLALLALLQSLNMNALIVQVKPTADAFYQSRYWPWSEYLTGEQGRAPGYDPLAFIVEEAHKRTMELHAWFNPYRVSLHDKLDALSAHNPARQHADWVVSYGGKLFFDPGIPAARKFIVTSILEVVSNYDIDAVHLDDYFYPYRVAGQDFPDDATYQRYGKAAYASKDDWRRANVNQLIAELAQAIKHAKSQVKFGVSPFGVWRNRSVDPSGSDTSASQTDYDDLYADTRAWLQHNWLDYIVPQIYWPRGFAPAAYDKLVPWWANEVAGKPVNLYIGQAAYRINTEPGAWADPAELPAQLRYNARFKEVQGSVFFSMKSLQANPLGFTDSLRQDFYQAKALVPAMPWLSHQALRPVFLKPARQVAQGVELDWSDAPPNPARAYALYRGEGQNIKFSSEAQAPLAVVHRQGHSEHQRFLDTTAARGKTYTYAVAALDRLSNESALSALQTITLS